MKTLKYSKNFERDWNYYSSQGIISGCSRMYGDGRWANTFDPDGVSAKHAFYLFDSTGVITNNQNPDLVCSALSAKGLGLQVTIEQWAEDTVLHAPNLSVAEVKLWCESLPSWVFKNYLALVEKLALKHIGFVPTFTRDRATC